VTCGKGGLVTVLHSRLSPILILLMHRFVIPSPFTLLSSYAECKFIMQNANLLSNRMKSRSFNVAERHGHKMASSFASPCSASGACVGLTHTHTRFKVVAWIGEPEL
jgi:hypothetical protein